MARPTREELLKDLNQALRTLSAQSVLLSDAVARLAGLTSTDLECLDLLLLSGVTTAGSLAAHTGLTTGAITAVIDRMERAGFARRQRDPNDRRRVLVEALPRYVQEIGPLYLGLSESTDKLHREYDDKQLAVVVDYMSRAFTLVAEHVNWLQTQPPLAMRAPLSKAALSTAALANAALSTAALTKTAHKTAADKTAAHEAVLPKTVLPKTVLPKTVLSKTVPHKTALSKPALTKTALGAGTPRQTPRVKAAHPATAPTRTTAHTPNRESGKWERITSSDIAGSRARR